MTRSVGIYLFDAVEVLDFAGPFEVFSTASRVAQRSDPRSDKPFAVCTIADARRSVTARGGLAVTADFTVHDHPALDLLIVPGGDVSAELGRRAIIEWIARTAASSRVTASVCTGVFLLGRAGLLEGLAVTTHWEDIGELRSMFPGVRVKEHRRWVDSGAVVTSAGISAGIDMSLHLVARLAGDGLAVRTARQMEFDWQPGGAGT